MAVAVTTQTFTATGTGTFASTASFVKIKGTGNLTMSGGVGTIKLEKSYDNGSNWFDVSLDSSGSLAAWALNGTKISILFDEPEPDVVYRANCTAYTSGTLTARISQ